MMNLPAGYPAQQTVYPIQQPGYYGGPITTYGPTYIQQTTSWAEPPPPPAEKQEPLDWLRGEVEEVCQLARAVGV